MVKLIPRGSGIEKRAGFFGERVPRVARGMCEPPCGILGHVLNYRITDSGSLNQLINVFRQI